MGGDWRSRARKNFGYQMIGVFIDHMADPACDDPAGAMRMEFRESPAMVDQAAGGPGVSSLKVGLGSDLLDNTLHHRGVDRLHDPLDRCHARRAATKHATDRRAMDPGPGRDGFVCDSGVAGVLPDSVDDCASCSGAGFWAWVRLHFSVFHGVFSFRNSPVPILPPERGARTTITCHKIDKKHR